MKHFIQFFAAVFFFFLLLLSIGERSLAQNADLPQLISEKITNGDFVFVAQSLTPMSGRNRILTSEYDARIAADSVISYLPYFGNAQSAPTTSAEAGIIFSSTAFVYTYEAAKKKSWDVSVKFKDQKNTLQFNFIIYVNGNATLNVISLMRDPISFRGYIKM